MTKKTAVILFNLGGPDRLSSVRPFLFNLFNDPAIIGLPTIMRWPLAKFISARRDKTARAIYAKLGGGSPLLKNTITQAKALEKKLGKGTKCFIAMRYWHPLTEDVAREVKKFSPDEVVLLPLYPQFSTTTSGSSIKKWQNVFGKKTPTKTICCYPTDAGFIKVLADKTRKAIMKNKKPVRVLFTAHGLPEKIIKSGDPYQMQCERTVSAIMQKLKMPKLDYVLCYQSRVGPMRWIGPSTDDEVRRAGAEGIGLIIVPIAFVSENSETLYELDMEYRHLAKEHKVKSFDYVGTVSTDKDFIDGLAGLVRKVQKEKHPCLAGVKGCCQNKGFARCGFSGRCSS